MKNENEESGVKNRRCGVGKKGRYVINLRVHASRSAPEAGRPIAESRNGNIGAFDTHCPPVRPSSTLDYLQKTLEYLQDNDLANKRPPTLFVAKLTPDTKFIYDPRSLSLLQSRDNGGANKTKGGDSRAGQQDTHRLRTEKLTSRARSRLLDLSPN